MIGGLSFFAVLTGVITSTFVARAQADAAGGDRPVVEKLTAMESELRAIGADVARLAAAQDRVDP